MKCYCCSAPLPKLLPNVKASFSDHDKPWSVTPDENGDLFVCLSCVPKMAEFYDIVIDDPLSAKKWIDANNEAWDKVEPEIDFLRQDYRSDTL